MTRFQILALALAIGFAPTTIAATSFAQTPRKAQQQKKKVAPRPAAQQNASQPATQPARDPAGASSTY